MLMGQLRGAGYAATVPAADDQASAEGAVEAGRRSCSARLGRGRSRIGLWTGKSPTQAPSLMLTAGRSDGAGRFASWVQPVIYRSFALRALTFQADQLPLGCMSARQRNAGSV